MTKRTTTTGVLAALVGLAAAGCGTPNVTMPAVPTEIMTVAAVYDTPTGTVPVDATQEIALLQQRLDTLDQTRLGDLMTDTLVKLRARLSGGGIATDPASVPRSRYPLIRGSVTLDRTCRDDASTTPDPVANGTIQLVAEVDNSRLERIVWGTATACHGRVDVTNDLTVHPFVDGTLAVYLEGPLPTDPSDAAFVMAWNGTLGAENTPQVTGGFDFRVVAPQVEVRIAVADGDIIGSVGLDQISLRGSNGTFGCSLMTFTCGSLQTARGDAPAP